MLSGDWKGFGKVGIDSFKQRLNSEIAYILIRADNPDLIDYVKAGESYQELTQLVKGYELRPAVQAIEEFAEMTDIRNAFQEEYGDGKEIMLIIGVRNGEMVKPPSIRHNVTDILIE